MAFIRESIPVEKWEFVDKYVLNRKCNEDSIWDVDYRREAYWIRVGLNALEHQDYYMLIWKNKKTFVGTYGWIDNLGDGDCVCKSVIIFQSDVSLKDDKEELVQIVREAMQCGYNKLVIKDVIEPDFSREIQ